MQTQHSWAAALLAKFAGSRSLGGTELAVDPRESFEFAALRADVVFKDNSDIIFQVFPNSGFNWPDGEDGRTFLAEAIEAHFGSTERFSAHYLRELSSWGILASGLAGLPTFAKTFHVDGFLQFLDDAAQLLE